MYRRVDLDAPLTQGDIIDGCPLLVWETSSANQGLQPGEFIARIIVLTQACDLAQEKTTRVVTALVHDAQKLVHAGILKPRVIQEQVRLHRVFGWYFLPASEFLGESIVDLRDLHTLPRTMLEDLSGKGQRLCQIESPYREHLAQHFAMTYSRIGLPLPYETRAD
jgi:hypothetical protein